MKRDRLVHTFGVLLAGLIEAEKDARQEQARRRRVRHGSGVYRLRDARPAIRLSEPPPAF